MKKHGILLSLLVAFFAVFVTACENLPLEDMLEGSNQGGSNTNPTLSFTYEKVNAMTYNFVGDLKNANPDDYTFTWKFGDEALLTNQGLEVSHTFKNDAAHTVILVAEPKDASVTKPATGYSDIVTASESGIIVEDFNYSNVSGLEFSFEVAASSVDGDALTYTWDFGDGEKLENSDQKVVTHKFPKFNATYPVSLVITSANGNTLNVPATEIKTSDLKAVITVVNNPENASSKTFSVNILDENDNIIHGSSTTSGDITGLTNVSYSWNFGDGNVAENVADRTVEHTYTTSTSDVYDVTVSVTTDNYDNAITATAEANVELSYSVPELITSLTGDYGLTIQASAKGFGGAKFANQQATYEFTLPNGEKQTKAVTHDATGNLAEAVVVTANLEKYYSNYPVTLEVKDSNGVVIATSTANATKPSFVYDLTIGNGGSYYTKVFTATPKAGSAFLLKNATYNWSYGDGASENGSESVSHTYNRPGTFNVTVNVSSPLLADTNITVKPVTKTVTLSQSITINSLNCKTDGAEYKFLQYTCTVDATASNGATPTYKWYVDNAAQSNQTANTFTKKYDKYNKTYTIKVEVGVEGISGVTPVTRTFSLGTPAVWALMTGPNYLTHGQEGIYTVVPKVTHNGITTDVTLTGANYTFKIKENGVTQNLGSSNKWTRVFEPTNEQYNGNNSVARTVTAVVSANNINGNSVTSSETVTTINRPVGTVADFQSAVISCSPANNGVNLAKQQCKVTLTVKNSSTAINGNFNEYKAKLTSNGVTKSVTFDDKALAAGASQVSTTVDFDFALPNGGDVVTGQAKSANYTVTGYVYKGVNEATKLTATAGNVNINLNVDYVIFPYPSGLEGKSGGSGYSFATWSCGYNERYGQGTLVGSKCASNAGTSGQTLKLGSYVDANGNLKGKTKFEWYIRINKANGQNIPMTKVAEFTVNKGSKPSDDQLKFNIAKALQYKQFIGSAYNNTTNTIFLQITPADEPNAKPVRVWYNGSNKGNYGNRLQKITPTVRNEHTCEVLFEYPNQFYPTIRYIQVYLRQFRYNFDGASRYNSMDFVIPSSTDYRPIIRVTSNIQGISSWSQHYVDDYNGYGIRESTDDWSGGWNMYLPELIKLRREENARGNSNINMTRTTATVDLLFKDMLQGSGSQLISGYYKTVSCKVSQSVK